MESPRRHWRMTGGLPIRAADLTENWMFNGGGDVENIYRRPAHGP